jgi:uncharacterized damage-inducible protein DinB
MNQESLRIADLLRRAYSGQAWHGDPLSKLLSGVTADQAQARPLPSAHSIWDLVLHIEIYAHIALEATKGIPMPKLYGTEKDWPKPVDPGEIAWTAATTRLFETAGQLAQAIETFSDARLEAAVPGREYDFYYLFHGIVQHSLYHGGQIAMLKGATLYRSE